ncbi:MAG: hypothetical protein ACPGWR_17895 [Ardenticatenaceae bacterium]
MEALGLKGSVHPHAIKLHDCGGKGGIKRKVHTILGAELGKAGANVRGVILRDLDENETKEGIVENVEEQLKKTLAQRGYRHHSIELTPHSADENVYLLNLTAPNLRLALHIATYRWREDFKNATIDDHVLSLALREQTIIKLLTKKKWTHITPEQVIRKVTTKIPDLLNANGMPLREAKDYVRLYSVVMQIRLSPAVFARKILANASDENKKETFASLLGAFTFVGETS